MTEVKVLLNLRRWTGLKDDIEKIRSLNPKYIANLWEHLNAPNIMSGAALHIFWVNFYLNTLDSTSFHNPSKNEYVPTDEELINLIEDKIDLAFDYSQKAVFWDFLFKGDASNISKEDKMLWNELGSLVDMKDLIDLYVTHRRKK